VVRYLPRRSAGAGRSIHSTFAWLVREASWLFGSASVRLFALTVRIAIAGGSRRPHGASIARGDPAVDTRNQEVNKCLIKDRATGRRTSPAAWERSLPTAFDARPRYPRCFCCLSYRRWPVLAGAAVVPGRTRLGRHRPRVGGLIRRPLHGRASRSISAARGQGSRFATASLRMPSEGCSVVIACKAMNCALLLRHSVGALPVDARLTSDTRPSRVGGTVRSRRTAVASVRLDPCSRPKCRTGTAGWRADCGSPRTCTGANLSCLRDGRRSVRHRVCAESAND